jgi:DNA-binding transcriptional LysR family regulator
VEAHEEAGAIMVASGKAIFMGAGAIVNRSVAGIRLASVSLNEPEAKIEVYAAWRKDDASPALHDFRNCIRSTLTPQRQRLPATNGRVITSHFPRMACDECSYARAAKTGR